MAFLNPTNQLLQIDTGNPRTYLFNPTLGLGAIAAYQGIGESQILGQRYFDSLTSATNVNGSPAIYMLVQYLSTSATADGDLKANPAPVYWTDNTFTTVTGITTEALGGTTLGLAFPAGFMLPNTTDISGLKAATVKGAYLLIQVAGYLKAAYLSGSTNAGIGAWIEPSAGTFTSAFVAAGSAATYQPFGRQLTALSSNVADVLVGCDII